MKNQRRVTPGILGLAALAIFWGTARPVHADIVTVLFTGFNPGSPSGMDALNLDLASRFAAEFPGRTYNGMVFGYNQRQQAFDFINGVSDIDQLFLVGHSWGGNALIRLAEQQLLPNGMPVDATFQIDSVDIFDLGLGDDVLPANVDRGFNYYQIATGLLEPQGEMFVLGAMNINVEVLFNDPFITHTSIDDDVRLYNEIYANMRLVVIPEPGSLAILACGWLAAGVLRRNRAPRRI